MEKGRQEQLDELYRYHRYSPIELVRKTNPIPPLTKDTVDQQVESTAPTRLAVIGRNGEIIYSNHNCEFELSWQDKGRTLKVFIK